jgi:hypothetical protein
MVADDGRVVVRAGGTATDPILLYAYALTTPAPKRTRRWAETILSRPGRRMGER